MNRKTITKTVSVTRATGLQNVHRDLLASIDQLDAIHEGCARKFNERAIYHLQQAIQEIQAVIAPRVFPAKKEQYSKKQQADLRKTLKQFHELITPIDLSHEVQR